MSIRRILILLLVFMPLSTIADETIYLSSGNWPPYISDQLPHYGVASRIVTESFANQGIKVFYEFRPWKRAYKEALVGKYTGSLIWSKHLTRNDGFYYSDVVIEGTSVFFYNKEAEFDWKNIDDLHNLTVGGALGYKYSMLEKLEHQGKLTITRLPSDLKSFEMLLLKRVDIVQLDLAAGYDLIENHFSLEDQLKLTHHSKPIVEDKYHLILSKRNKDNKRLIEKFNKGLKELKNSGKFDFYIQESGMHRAIAHN